MLLLFVISYLNAEDIAARNLPPGAQLNEGIALRWHPSEGPCWMLTAHGSGFIPYIPVRTSEGTSSGPAIFFDVPVFVTMDGRVVRWDGSRFP